MNEYILCVVGNCDLPKKYNFAIVVIVISFVPFRLVLSHLIVEEDEAPQCWVYKKKKKRHSDHVEIKFCFENMVLRD